MHMPRLASIVRSTVLSMKKILPAHFENAMKTNRKPFLFIAVAALLLLTGCMTPSDAIRVGTYNIRYSFGDKGTPNEWESRRADLVATVQGMDLDVFGMQEVCPDQMAYLRERLPEFEFVGDHREADRKSGEASPVAYRKSRFEAEKSGTFWLSETPDVPASKSWGTCCMRVCSYLVLRDKPTGKRFCFANTHTDHVSAEAREKGMLLIIERMKDFGNGVPIVFTGDHNCKETESPARAVAKLLDNALYVTETPPKGGWRTWNGWRWRDREVSTAEALALPIDARNENRPHPDADGKTRGNAAALDDSFYEKCGGPRIDYIYVTPGTRVTDYETVNGCRKALKTYASDHFPVTATIVMP